ncbi:MAG TPA: protein-glutamate O-methyltransferase CheR, partial [Candidatus Acidoferrum sp.]|nr:protein-glutamate O-methyltransferase CheR [Candidatus Acidoferrum sp.]
MSGAVAMAGGIDPLNDREFQALRVLIRQLTGIHLADGKRELVSSRLRRRVQALGMSSYGQYHDHVARGGGGPAERTALINCITTNKTDFFREPHHFVFLRRLAAKWRQRPPAGRALRIWSAGCSTGEEPYSISIALHDLLPAGAGWDVRVLASDIDTDVLAHAREGFYRPERLADLPRSAERYFVRENDGLRVVPEIRERVDFRQVNLIGEWNLPERFDLVFCRNVVIYFDRETQERLFTRFARQLSPGG